MKKLHYYQIRFLLGSLLAGPLHAANDDNSDQDDQKYPDISQKKASAKSFYQHGDLTFIDREKDKVDQEELNQGLIDLSYRIKAKDGRKVYFFIGGTGAGKSMSIMALQGNKIKKIEEDSSDDDESDDDLSLIKKAPFEIQYVLPYSECPKIGHSACTETKSTYIYYPDPNKPQYKDIAFADTEGFLGRRLATPAEKCLSVVSLAYALKANRVGGLVLVVSKPQLEAKRGKRLRDIAHILQEYFAKAVSEKTIKESILVMITKVSNKDEKTEALYKFRSLIQLFYQEYYAESDNKEILKNELLNLREHIQKNEALKKQLESKKKKQDENRHLKYFCEMLLKQDVPQDQINDIKNFKLHKDRFSFILPWKKTEPERILGKKLKNLKPIDATDLCTFDNPVSQYMQARILDISIKLYKHINPLLATKSSIERKQKALEGIKTPDVLGKAIEEVKKAIGSSNKRKSELEIPDTQKAVFRQSHYETLPATQGMLTLLIEKWRGYRLFKAFEYTAAAPVYRIEATYGLEAELVEDLSYYQLIGGASSKFNFIEKHFNITEKKNDNGTTTWKAVSKHGKGVVKKDKWLLYHVTKGEHKAQCELKFYSLNKELGVTKELIGRIGARIKLLKDDLDFYKKMLYKNSELEVQEENWRQQDKKTIKVCFKTVKMLKFIAGEIFEDGTPNAALIKDDVASFHGLCFSLNLASVDLEEEDTHLAIFYPKKNTECKWR